MIDRSFFSSFALAFIAGVLIWGVLLLFTGCAVNPKTGLPNFGKGDALATLGKFTVKDLKEADALALAATRPDQVAHTCFAFLIPVVEDAAAAQAKPGLPVSGAFSAFEAGRIAVGNGKLLLAGVPQDLNVACAPLVLDSANTVLGLAAKVGITAAVGLLP